MYDPVNSGSNTTRASHRFNEVIGRFRESFALVQSDFEKFRTSGEEFDIMSKLLAEE